MSYFSSLQSAISAAYAPSSSPLVSHWTCDNIAGGGNLVDEVHPTNSNYYLNLSGTLGTNYKINQTGLLPADSGKSLWFDGTAGYARNNISALTADFSATGYTVIVWAQSAGNVALRGTTPTIVGVRNKYLIGHDFSSNSKRYGFDTYTATNVDHHAVWSNTDSLILPTATTTPDPTRSIMLALVFTTSGMTMYVNGVAQTSSFSGSDNTFGTTPAFGIGALGNGTSFWNGYAQHVSVVGASLSASLIRSIYQIGTDTSIASTVGTVKYGNVAVYPWSVPVISANPTRKKLTLTNDSRYAVTLTPQADTGGHTGAQILLKPYGGRYVTNGFTGSFTGVVAATYSIASLSYLEEN